MADINSIVLPDGTEYPVSDYYLPLSISSPTNGQVLKYDATNHVWYNGNEAGGSTILYGTTAPSSSLGSDGSLYVQYTEGTGGASDEVDALFVKLDDDWCEISTGGGGGASSADEVSVDDTDLEYSADDVQEALEKVTKTLTWAEYQALSDAEKNNGTIYMISDVNGDEQSFQPIIYSEDERKIGVWTDGKPLYEKVIDLGSDTNISYNSWTLTSVSISSVDRLILIQGLNSAGTAFYGDLLGGNNNGYLQLQTSRNGSEVTVQYLIFRYTKTTDTPGSGTWTPQGVPAHHYSEDEHVVGTWIDGKTLYEKTIVVTNKTARPSDWAEVVTLSGVDKIAHVEGWFTISTVDYFEGYYVRFMFDHSTNKLNYYCQDMANTSGDITVIIRYTKTS